MRLGSRYRAAHGFASLLWREPILFETNAERALHTPSRYRANPSDAYAFPSFHCPMLAWCDRRRRPAFKQPVVRPCRQP